MVPPIDGFPAEGRILGSVHHWVSNLSFGSGVQVCFASPAHLSTSAPLSRPGHWARYPASYPATTAWRSHSRLCWFPVGFRPPAFASWTSCSRQRIPLSSQSAYRTHHHGGPDSVGVPMFRTHE